MIEIIAQAQNNFKLSTGTIIAVVIIVFLVIALIKTARIVPQREAYVVERLGKYSKTLGAGFHILIPFVDKIAYKHSLKEIAMDVPPQNCITKDNIAIEVDGVLYMQVLDPKKASYGIDNYFYASTQLAQTTLRSEIGKLELDRHLRSVMPSTLISLKRSIKRVIHGESKSLVTRSLISHHH